MLTRFVIYGAAGCLMEVFWTGLGSLIKRNFKLISTTSIWMFFIYGMAVAMEPLLESLRRSPFILRGLVYMTCIFVIEYVTGFVLKCYNLCPWDYSDNKWNINGVIRLDFAPLWFIVGLIFERIYFMF